jgi:hypothetical protein
MHYAVCMYESVRNTNREMSAYTVITDVHVGSKPKMQAGQRYTLQPSHDG